MAETIMCEIFYNYVVNQQMHTDKVCFIIY